MGYSENQTTSQATLPLLKLFTSGAGIAFILIGLGLTVVIAITGFNFISEPEHFSSLMNYAKEQESLFAKWVTTDDIQSFELSNIFSLLIIVIAICMVLRVIIAFISMCIGSGKSLLNTSRNF